MSETEQNKSEPPSAHKLTKARRKGQVVRGLDLGFLSGLGALSVYGWMAGASLIDTLKQVMREALISSTQVAADPGAILATTTILSSALMRPIAIFAGSVFAMVLLFELLQTGVVFSLEPMKLDLSRLNPAQGVKRVFSMRLLIETGKNVLKLIIYTLAAWLVVRRVLTSAIGSIDDAPSLASGGAHAAVLLVASFGGTAVLFALLDQLITRRDFFKRMRMSRREVKQEMRDREGEPRVKQKRKQLHAEFAQGSRSIRGLRGADMLIVNPRHVAVALHYDGRRMTAPTVVSVGINRLALRLKRLAFIYAIPIIEDRTLAHSLLRSSKIGQTIPTSEFRPVAQIYNRLREQQASQGRS